MMRSVMMAMMAVAMVAGLTGCGTIGQMGERFGFGEDLLKTTVLVVAEREGVDLNADDVDTVTELLRNSLDLQTELDAIAQRQANQRLLEEQITKYLVDGQLVMDGNIYDAGSTEPVGQVEVPADWSNIKWISENYAGAERDPGMTLTARCTAETVQFGYDDYDWPEKSDSGLDAIACFFVWTGEQWEGGKFEWIRSGGQSSKHLKNIKEGYGGLSAPAPGTRVAFAWVSVDGKQRSNLAEATWQ